MLNSYGVFEAENRIQWANKLFLDTTNGAVLEYFYCS